MNRPTIDSDDPRFADKLEALDLLRSGSFTTRKATKEYECLRCDSDIQLGEQCARLDNQETVCVVCAAREDWK